MVDLKVAQRTEELAEANRLRGGRAFNGYGSQHVTRSRNSMKALKRSGDVYSVGIIGVGPPTSVSPAKTNAFAAIRKEKPQ
jgi:hypothetical protein